MLNEDIIKLFSILPTHLEKDEKGDTYFWFNNSFFAETIFLGDDVYFSFRSLYYPEVQRRLSCKICDKDIFDKNLYIFNNFILKVYKGQ